MTFKAFLLSAISLGFYAEPFDRALYAQKTFALNDIDLVEDDSVARQLRALIIRNAVDNAEQSYNVKIANRRAIIVAMLSIIVMALSVVTNLKAIKVAHDDSISTASSLVEAITDGIGTQKVQSR